MNDLLSLIKKDLTSLIEKLFNDDVIKNNISNKLTIDYNSKSKQGDLSSNVLFILKGQILNKSFNIALPKGRILNSVLPILSKVGIKPEVSFFDSNDRKLKFKTNLF